MNVFSQFLASALIASSLAIPALADGDAAAGSSNLDRIVIHEAVPREPAVGAISRDVALFRLRQKGFKISGPLRREGKTWFATDAKTGKPLTLDSGTGAIVSATGAPRPRRLRRLHKN